MEKDSYALELTRYIALNPVRAGIVADPSRWKWSSYLATIGKAPRPRFLSSDWVLQQFGRDANDSRRAFRQFVLDGIGGEAPWKNLKAGFVLGGEGFIKKLT